MIPSAQHQKMPAFNEGPAQALVSIGMKLADTLNSILGSKGRQVWSVSPDTSVFDALAMMANHEIGALLVVADDRPVGISSERDYARKVIVQGKSSKLLEVREIMPSPVISVAPQNTVDDCLNLMTANRIRHLLVIDNDRIVGIVSIGDPLQAQNEKDGRKNVKEFECLRGMQEGWLPPAVQENHQEAQLSWAAPLRAVKAASLNRTRKSRLLPGLSLLEC